MPLPLTDPTGRYGPVTPDTPVHRDPDEDLNAMRPRKRDSR